MVLFGEGVPDIYTSSSRSYDLPELTRGIHGFLDVPRSESGVYPGNLENSDEPITALSDHCLEAVSSKWICGSEMREIGVEFCHRTLTLK